MMLETSVLVREIERLVGEWLRTDTEVWRPHYVVRAVPINVVHPFDMFDLEVRVEDGSGNVVAYLPVGEDELRDLTMATLEPLAKRVAGFLRSVLHGKAGLARRRELYS